ncbi:excisionase family DNA-binding protein [Aeromicrobium sp. CTD01-1L150]|uniref:excisionase family DNA-binding protein n=1 Tax=Aeromicrobium sp. CTD01-1L150 TaxID=3341830 RepID=UPI0035C00F70
MSVGVSEAAERLGVSRQRVLQMIADRSLPAERVGRSWSINEVDLAHRRVPLGRPLSPEMARGFLELAAGSRPSLDARNVSRLRARMVRLVREVSSGGDPAGLLRSWLPHRADRLEKSVAAADLGDAMADHRLAASGVSDPRAGMASPGMGEGYVDEQLAAPFFAEHFAVDADSSVPANLIVHVARRVPPISPVLIAADLADYRAGREDGQAHVVLAEWIESGDYDEDLVFGRRRP